MCWRWCRLSAWQMGAQCTLRTTYERRLCCECVDALRKLSDLLSVNFNFTLFCCVNRNITLHIKCKYSSAFISGTRNGLSLSLSLTPSLWEESTKESTFLRLFWVITVQNRWLAEFESKFVASRTVNTANWSTCLLMRVKIWCCVCAISPSLQLSFSCSIYLPTIRK